MWIANLGICFLSTKAQSVSSRKNSTSIFVRKFFLDRPVEMKRILRMGQGWDFTKNVGQLG